MSNIPSTALTSALTPVQRQTNESMRARKIQAQKNQHHTEDVEELDDTAVDSVHDQAQRKNQQQDDAEDTPKEKVDIESLKKSSQKPGPKKSSSSPQSHLDISA